MESNSKTPSLAAALLLISPFFLWGTAMVAMKGVLADTTPFFMAGIRLFPAGLLILLVGVILKRSQPQGWRAWGWIGLFALVDGALFQGFLAQGLVKTGAGLGSVIIDTQPLAVALLSSWLFGEVIGLWGGLGLGLGILGISLIGLPDAWFLQFFQSHITLPTVSLTGLLQSGELLMLLASLSMALGTVMIRYVSRYADPVVATGWHMVLGGVPLFVLSGLWETGQWNHLTISDELALAYATVFGSAIAYGVFFWLASQENLTSFSSLTFLTPVFALSFGNLLLAEVLTPLQWAGVAVTLLSVYLVNQREQLAHFKVSPFSILLQRFRHLVEKKSAP